MKLLKSRKFELPEVYFISEREELKEVPVGVPFIYGDSVMEEHLVRILEYEVLYQEAIKTGYPFDFRAILRDAGYTDLEACSFSHPCYLEYTSEGLDVDGELSDLKSIKHDTRKFKKFVKDSTCYVDVQKLKALKVFPVWLDKIEEAVHTNIHNFAVYNNNMYNKKLEGMYGAIDLVSPHKNLIIIDISGSIPKAVSSTCLALAKNLAETFFADLMITGSKSSLYVYENLGELNIHTIYDENGMDNDQVWFKKLVTQDVRAYKTAIVFGDNHSPCRAWGNSFNHGSRTISRDEGKKLCQWTIDKVISFHTSNRSEDDKHVAGYADWFTPTETEYIHGWLKYLN
jgi:hypothetical protein